MGAFDYPPEIAVRGVLLHDHPIPSLNQALFFFFFLLMLLSCYHGILPNILPNTSGGPHRWTAATNVYGFTRAPILTVGVSFLIRWRNRQ